MLFRSISYHVCVGLRESVRCGSLTSAVQCTSAVPVLERSMTPSLNADQHAELYNFWVQDVHPNNSTVDFTSLGLKQYSCIYLVCLFHTCPVLWTIKSQTDRPNNYGINHMDIIVSKKLDCSRT